MGHSTIAANSNVAGPPRLRMRTRATSPSGSLQHRARYRRAPNCCPPEILWPGPRRSVSGTRTDAGAAGPAPCAVSTEDLAVPEAAFRAAMPGDCRGDELWRGVERRRGSDDADPAVICRRKRARQIVEHLPRPWHLRRAWGGRQAFLVFLACCIVGCGDSNSPAPCSATSVGVLSVSGGLNPTISWAADCPAQVLAVYDLRTGFFDVWHVTADTRSIPKPVVYGVVPAGAKELHAAEPLQPGTHYGVYVAVLVGTDTLASVGGFTP
jgi:hypothetical protein